MSDNTVTNALSEQAADSANYTKAILNILEDAGLEKVRLEATQKAVLNIIDDSSIEKQKLEAAQRATLNILEDFSNERAKLDNVQSAVLNILDDFSAERVQLESTQKAVLNILDDFDAEKNKVEQINRDMTKEIAERKQAEESLRQAKAVADSANRELEAFSYSVAHDLRAPLRGMDGFSQALLEDYSNKLDEQGKDYLQRIRNSSQRMAQLIDDMLNLSKVTRSEMRHERVNLSEIANVIIADLKRTQPERNVTFNIGDDIYANGDKQLLRIALENLFGNAWKFTSHHSAAHIEFGSFKQQDDKVVYFVRDDGAGFDMTYVNKLFGAFQRLHSVNEFSGTGIGLATVQRIINRHGGKIWAEGKVEKGATFYFTV